jgi:arginine/lysine/ornithine decarboxylase
VTTGRVDQERAPIWETLTGYARSGIYGFHTPGHKGGRFAAPEILAMVGKRGLELDLPAMTATDNTFHPTGCIDEAQRLASDLFGSAETIFLSAGSTLGVATALLATVPADQTVALPRNIHRSVVAGLVLSGALPRFIPHDVLPECGALGVTPERLVETLDKDPRPAAVLLTRPSYYGLARELADVVAVCRKRQIPLIVDEAHGAHLHFLPHSGDRRPACQTTGEPPVATAEAPTSALAAGADLVVQSCHKTLGSLLGSAQLHIGRGSKVDPAQVRDALNVLQTTSPSFLLLASLDVMRRFLWREGRDLFAAAVDEAHRLEDAIDALPGLRVLRPENEPRLAGHRRDPLRLVVNVSGTGWSGYEVERHLRTKFQVEDEMADWFNVVYVLSPQDDAAARERLLAGLRDVSERPNSGRVGTAHQSLPSLTEVGGAHPTRLLQPPIPPLAMPPRQAGLARKIAVPLAAAAGRTCAEMVMFYPPGIPLLMPGELVTAETIDVCRQLQAAGAHAYAADTTLATVRVVE